MSHLPLVYRLVKYFVLSIPSSGFRHFQNWNLGFLYNSINRSLSFVMFLFYILPNSPLGLSDWTDVQFI